MARDDGISLIANVTLKPVYSLFSPPVTPPRSLNHTQALAAIYPGRRRISVWDSLGGASEPIVEILKRYLQDEFNAKQPEVRRRMGIIRVSGRAGWPGVMCV